MKPKIKTNPSLEIIIIENKDFILEIKAKLELNQHNYFEGYITFILSGYLITYSGAFEADFFLLDYGIKLNELYKPLCF